MAQINFGGVEERVVLREEFPLEKAKEVFGILKQEFGNVAWDDNGNIGKRYRRQDEIGTPFCVVIDFDSLEKNLNLILIYLTVLNLAG